MVPWPPGDGVPLNLDRGHTVREAVARVAKRDVIIEAQRLYEGEPSYGRVDADGKFERDHLTSEGSYLVLGVVGGKVAGWEANLHSSLDTVDDAARCR